MFLLVVFLGLIQGIVSFSRGSPCSELRKFMDDKDILPDDAEDFAFRCPKMKIYIECERNHIEENNLDHKLKELYNARSLVNDLCDEDSKLHKDYINNINCFKSLLDSKWSVCEDLGRDVYSEFSKLIPAVEDREDFAELNEDERHFFNESVLYYQPQCTIQSYAFACLGIEVLETCGADAFYAFLEIGIRTRVFKRYCRSYESGILQTEFVDFLSTEKKHPHMDKISGMFGFMKK